MKLLFKNLRIILPAAVMIMMLILYPGCSLNPETGSPADVQESGGVSESGSEQPVKNRALISLDPVTHDDLYHIFTGYGYDGLNKQVRSRALINSKVSLYTDDRVSALSYKYIENIGDFEAFKHDSGATSLSLYQGIEFNASLAAGIESKINTSSRKIYVLARGYYRYGTVILEQANMDTSLDNNALDMYKNNNDLFIQNYGNAYVKQNIIGDTIFILYTYEIQSDSRYSYDYLKTKIHARVEGLFNTDVGYEHVDKEALTDMGVSESFELIGNGYLPSTPFNLSMNDGIKNMMNEFCAKVLEKYDNKALSGDWKNANSLGTVLESYETLMKINENKFDLYYDMLLKWVDIMGKLINVRNDLENGYLYVSEPERSSILDLINDRIIFCSGEVEKCRNRTQTVYPKLEDFEPLINYTKPMLIFPDKYGVVAPGNVSLSWVQKNYLLSYKVFVNEALAYEQGNSSGVTGVFIKPGVYHWFVRGYDAKGNFSDSKQELFNVPGFNTECSPKDGSTVAMGDYTFYFVPLSDSSADSTSDVRYYLYVNGVQKNTGYEAQKYFTVAFDSMGAKRVYLEAEIYGHRARSATLTINVLSIPQPKYPIDNTIVAPGNIRFTWANYFSSYEIYLDNNPAPAASVGNSPGTNVNITRPGNHTYFIRAYKDGAYFDSEPVSFNIPGFDAGGSPAHCSLMAPGEKSFYFAQLYGNQPNDSDITYTLGVNGRDVYSGKSIFTTIDIEQPGENILQLKARITSPPGDVEAASEPLKLYILSTPVITGPGSGDTFGINQTILWNGIPGATAYRVVCRQDNIAYADKTVTATSCAVTLQEGMNAVQISALAGSSYEGRSLPAEISLNVYSDNFTLKNPVNNAVFNDYAVTFSWNALAGIDHYELYIDNTGQYSGKETSTGFIFSQPGNNSWYVKAVTLNGAFTVSETRTVTVGAEPATLTLSNRNIFDTQVFEAVDSITAGNAFTVHTGGNVKFQAGSFIQLNDGFTVEDGAVFDTAIQ